MDHASKPRFNDPLRAFEGVMERAASAPRYDGAWAKRMSMGLTQFSRDLKYTRRMENTVHEAVQAWDDATAMRLGYFSDIGLIESFHSHAHLQHLPTNQWLQNWYRESYGKLAELGPKELVKLLHAHAQLGLRPPYEWLVAWEHAACIALPDFSQHQCELGLYALSVMQLLGANVRNAAEPLADTLRSLLADNDYTVDVRGAQQFHQASSVFGWQEDPRLLQALWNDGNDHHRTSSAETKLGNLLDSLCERHKSIAGWTLVNVEKEVMHPLTFSPSDFKLTLTKNGGMLREMYLEVDGQSHFSYHSSGVLRQNGKTLIRDHLMQRWAHQNGGGFGTILLQKTDGPELHNDLVRTVKFAMSQVPQPVVHAVAREPNRQAERQR